jgi:hypothetical protein
VLWRRLKIFDQVHTGLVFNVGLAIAPDVRHVDRESAQAGVTIAEALVEGAGADVCGRHGQASIPIGTIRYLVLGGGENLAADRPGLKGGIDAKRFDVRVWEEVATALQQVEMLDSAPADDDFADRASVSPGHQAQRPVSLLIGEEQRVDQRVGRRSIPIQEREVCSVKWVNIGVKWGAMIESGRTAHTPLIVPVSPRQTGMFQGRAELTGRHPGRYRPA